MRRTIEVLRQTIESCSEITENSDKLLLLQISRHVVNVLDDLDQRISNIESLLNPRIFTKITKKEN